MPVPAVKGFMPLCVTPRSSVCDEQGSGQWPMWERYDSVMAIVNQYVDDKYRNFLSMPYHVVDHLKAEELFYWFTPSCDTSYVRMDRTESDRVHYRNLLAETLAHYRSVVNRLHNEGKDEEALFLQLSLKYAGDFEENVYCGDNCVVATVWGMRPREAKTLGTSKLTSELVPDVDIHTVRYELGVFGTSSDSLTYRKRHGSKIYPQQVPAVIARDGYSFVGWDQEPEGATVTGDLLFTARYQKDYVAPKTPATIPGTDHPESHHVRFLTPDGGVIGAFEVKHGERIAPALIPQLPLFNGVRCMAWNRDPYEDVITEDIDYRAVAAGVHGRKFRVRFLTEDGEVLSQLMVDPGTRLKTGQIPPLPETGGKRFEWDPNPVSTTITSDRDFIASPKTRTRALFGKAGCLSAFLNWLLLGLGLLLLLLLLWCLIFGKCPFSCGCDCDKQNPIPPGPTPVQNPCNTSQTAGGEEGYLGYFDMGQDSGSFPFSFDTYSFPDRITIYDGKGKSGGVIYSYEGGSKGPISILKPFTQRYVTVEIVGLESGTAWDFTIGCPEKK